MTRAEARKAKQDTIIDYLMDPLPLKNGATATAIAAGTGLDVKVVYSELAVLETSRKLVEVRGHVGSLKPTQLFGMRRTKPIKAAK
jgi:hypothetical protein